MDKVVDIEIPSSPSSPPNRLGFWDVIIDPKSPEGIKFEAAFVLRADRPLLLYFAGQDSMGKRKPDTKELKEIISYLSKFTPGTFSLVAVSEISMVPKHTTIENYNEDPYNYVSAGGEELWRTAIKPLIDNADNKEVAASLINMFGHSYGAGFVQNFANAVPPELRPFMGAIGLGIAAKPVAKDSNLSQLFLGRDADFAIEGVDYKEVVDQAPNKHIHPTISHAKLGKNTLFLLSHVISILSQFEYLDKTTVLLALKKGEDGQYEDKRLVDVNGHTLRSHMNVDKHTKAGLEIFQHDPGAAIARYFINRMLQTSFDALNSGKPRDLVRVIDQIIREQLSPEAKDLLRDRLEKNQLIVDKLLPKGTGRPKDVWDR